MFLDLDRMSSVSQKPTTTSSRALFLLILESLQNNSARSQAGFVIMLTNIGWLKMVHSDLLPEVEQMSLFVMILKCLRLSRYQRNKTLIDQSSSAVILKFVMILLNKREVLHNSYGTRCGKISNVQMFSLLILSRVLYQRMLNLIFLDGCPPPLIGKLDHMMLSFIDCIRLDGLNKKMTGLELQYYMRILKHDCQMQKLASLSYPDRPYITQIARFE